MHSELVLSIYILWFTFKVQDFARKLVFNPHNLQVVTSLADPSANIIFGAVVDDRYSGEIHVTIIATGFSQSFQKTLFADPKAAKVVDSHESNNVAHPLKAAANSSPSSRSRKLFF